MSDWSLTTLKEKLIKIGAKVVSHGRYIVFQMAKSQSHGRCSRRFCHLSRNCGCCRHRHRHETSDLHASTATNGRSASECHAKWPPCMPAMLLGSRENRYNLSHFRAHPGNPGCEGPPRRSPRLCSAR